MDKLPVAVLICTFRRPKEIRITLDALLKHLTYPQERLSFFICDDSSGESYVDDLIRDYPFLHPVITPERSGWGVNVNGGLKHIYAGGFEYVFFSEDDYPLHRDLDFTSAIHLMENTDVELVRFDGIAGHNGLHAQMCECDLDSNFEGLQVGKLNYLKLLKSSSHLNIYSNRPHLKHRRFHEFYGLYPEGLPLGITETSFAHIFRDKMELPNAPQVAVLPDWVYRYFDDIGTSYQLSKEDMETVQHDR